MNVYTTSKLARDAGVSIHIVRDYEVRGLLRVAGRTEGGYCIYDPGALDRLRFVRAARRPGLPWRIWWSYAEPSMAATRIGAPIASHA